MSRFSFATGIEVVMPQGSAEIQCRPDGTYYMVPALPKPERRGLPSIPGFHREPLFTEQQMRDYAYAVAAAADQSPPTPKD